MSRSQVWRAVRAYSSGSRSALSARITDPLGGGIQPATIFFGSDEGGPIGRPTPAQALSFDRKEVRRRGSIKQSIFREWQIGHLGSCSGLCRIAIEQGAGHGFLCEVIRHDPAFGIAPQVMGCEFLDACVAGRFFHDLPKDFRSHAIASYFAVL